MTIDTDRTLTLIKAALSSVLVTDYARARRQREAGGSLDRARWSELADGGWLSVLVPEEMGGDGPDLPAAILVAQRLGYTAALEPFVGCGVMAPLCLSHADDPAAVATRLSAVLDGSVVCAPAWLPQSGRFVPTPDGVDGLRCGGRIRLSGTARFMECVQTDAMIVAARVDGDVALFWVDRDRDGVEIESEPTVDGGALARVLFTDVAVDASDEFVSATKAGDVLALVADAGLITLSAEMVGSMERMLEMTLGYLSERRQFGRRIGSFQALQHRIVDQWIQVELCKAALAAAGERWTQSLPETERSALASGLKARASAAGRAISDEALQMHGAIGFTEAFDLGLHINRMLVLSARMGTAAEHLRRFGTLTPLPAV